MIKIKSDVDENLAFEEACKNNNIILTPENTNHKPVSYIDPNGNERFFEPINHSNTLVRRDFNVGDTIRVFSKIIEDNNEIDQVFEGKVTHKKFNKGYEEFTVRKKSRGVYVDKTWFLGFSNIQKIEIVKMAVTTRRAKLKLVRNRTGEIRKQKME